MKLSISEILNGNQEEFYRILMETVSNNLRVSMPGIIQSFDPVEQVVTVQPAIRERIRNPDHSYSWTNLPLLVDVPIVIPRAGGFSLTLPVQQGDECLVIFGDMTIDGWWANGGIQNQLEKRRHDLSDAFAILGCWSQPRIITNYSTSAAQLRTDDGKAYISLSSSGINFVAPANSITANGKVIG